MVARSNPVSVARARGLTIAALLAASLVLSGCATAEDPAPELTAEAEGTPGDDVGGDLAAARLDGGRMFAVVTWGSSSCPPIVDSATVEDETEEQTVSVTLADPPGDQPCTADMGPRASLGAFPEGVDPTKDVELLVEYDDLRGAVDLPADEDFTAAPTSETDFEPSAAWFDDRGIVLLTWGSSTCAPTATDVEQTASGATVTLSVPDGPCTLDMAPRATLIALADDARAADFALVLSGAEFDDTVDVLGG